MRAFYAPLNIHHFARHNRSNSFAESSSWRLRAQCYLLRTLMAKYSHSTDRTVPTQTSLATYSGHCIDSDKQASSSFAFTAFQASTIFLSCGFCYSMVFHKGIQLCSEEFASAGKNTKSHCPVQLRPARTKTLSQLRV